MVLEGLPRLQPDPRVSGSLVGNRSPPYLKPELTDAEKRLIAAYTEAALRIERELRSFKSPKDKARILQRINTLLEQLDDLSADWITEGLTEQFRIGSALALSELRKLRIPDLDTGFSNFHREAVQSLADDARLRFGNLIDAVKRDAAVKLSEATKAHILQEMMVKELEGGINATEAVTDILKAQGIVAIQTRGGRRGLEEYADVLVRSITAEAHNTGAATRYASNGVEYARVIERDTACEICRPMDDKVIWLGDARLRPPYHPRCRGGIAPVLSVPENPIRSPDDLRVPQATRETMKQR